MKVYLIVTPGGQAITTDSLMGIAAHFEIKITEDGIISFRDRPDCRRYRLEDRYDDGFTPTEAIKDFIRKELRQFPEVTIYIAETF